MSSSRPSSSTETNQSLASWRHREVLTVLGLGLLTVLLWRLPVVGLIFYPFRLFGTFVHELSHGLTAIATGGAFRRFIVNPDFSGTAWSAGGIKWLVTSAGYIGTALAGGFLTLLSARGVSARRVLVGLGILLGLLCLLFVRNVFGVVTGLLIAGALFLAGRLPRLWADGLLLLLAVQLILNGFDSLWDLVLLSTQRPQTLTDAQIMASATGIPAIVWAVLWSCIAGAVLWVTLRVAYRRPPPRRERHGALA